MVALSEKEIIIIVLSSQYCVIVKAAKMRVLLQVKRSVLKVVIIKMHIKSGQPLLYPVPNLRYHSLKFS